MRIPGEKETEKLENNQRPNDCKLPTFFQNANFSDQKRQ